MNEDVAYEDCIESKCLTSTQRLQSPKDVPPKGLRRFSVSALLRLAETKKSPATRHARVFQ
ncbi:MAG: hypothetical protein ACOY3I_09025 [Verrucomicrobiota bacterium]